MKKERFEAILNYLAFICEGIDNIYPKFRSAAIEAANNIKKAKTENCFRGMIIPLGEELSDSDLNFAKELLSIDLQNLTMCGQFNRPKQLILLQIYAELINKKLIVDKLTDSVLPVNIQQVFDEDSEYFLPFEISHVTQSLPELTSQPINKLTNPSEKKTSQPQKYNTQNSRLKLFSSNTENLMFTQVSNASSKHKSHKDVALNQSEISLTSSKNSQSHCYSPKKASIFAQKTTADFASKIPFSPKITGEKFYKKILNYSLYNSEISTDNLDILEINEDDLSISEMPSSCEYKPSSRYGK